MGRRKKLETTPIPEPTSIKISSKVTLQPGDKIRVSQGPYYVCKDGRKINMGYYGKGIYLRSYDAENIFIKFAQRSELVYIGPEYVSDVTGTIMRPHKITKIREKKIKENELS
jgi:hypothetical protein